MERVSIRYKSRLKCKSEMPTGSMENMLEFQSAINRVLNVNLNKEVVMEKIIKFQSAINRVLNVNIHIIIN